MILTLEVNKVRNSHGVTVDTVDVLYERKQVGRLSTQMSQQFIPIINHAFDHDLLTAVWGTIRGSSFEVSMTLQAARAPEVPAQWFTELPNDVPELLPEAEQYEVPAAYVAVESDHGRNSKKWRRGFTAAHPEATGAGSPASGARALAARWRGGESTRTGQDTAGALVAEHDAAGTAPAARNTAGSTVAGVARGLRPLVTALLALTVLLVVVGIVLLGVEPLATTLVMIVALATGFMAVYLHRTL